MCPRLPISTLDPPPRPLSLARRAARPVGPTSGELPPTLELDASLADVSLSSSAGQTPQSSRRSTLGDQVSLFSKTYTALFQVSPFCVPPPRVPSYVASGVLLRLPGFAMPGNGGHGADAAAHPVPTAPRCLQGIDPSKGRPSFWDQLFLLKVGHVARLATLRRSTGAPGCCPGLLPWSAAPLTQPMGLRVGFGRSTPSTSNRW